MKPWIAAFVALGCLVASAAAAADDKSDPAKKDADSKPPIVMVAPSASVVPEATGPRPTILKSLYAMSIGLQAFDGVSTFVGMRRGNAELNPAMQNATPTTLVVAKATMTLTTIAVAEQLWRTHHRGQAIAVMAISNGVMAAVAAKNASALR
ncbi:MAG TPA: hypothetical protein VIW45_08695 [Vicinamibacterales bacterium]|jgi:hypothetical protein